MSDIASAAPDSEPLSMRPGPELASARERCGYSIADVARQLKLSPAQVEAMEADDYERLPGPIFTRGFIRNYARLVKLDPEPLLADSKGQLTVTAVLPPPVAPSANIPFPRRAGFKWVRYAAVMVLVVVALAAYEFYRGDDNEVMIKSRPVVQQPVEAAAEVAPEPSAVVAAPASDALRAAETTTAKPTKAQRAGTREFARGTPEPQGTLAVEHSVKLRFERDSWVEIRDRNGRKITSQLNPAGTELAISGLPPLSLVVGNAAGVRLTYNDQPVDLARHIKVDVARLTLD